MVVLSVCLLVSIWTTDCSFKNATGFPHLILGTQRSFPGLHGSSPLPSSSSGWSVVSQAHLYSTIQKSGQRSQDRRQHTVSTPLKSVWIFLHRFSGETYIKILHVVLVRKVWNFNCSSIFYSCFWLSWWKKKKTEINRDSKPLHSSFL